MLVLSLVSGRYIFKGDVKLLGNIDLSSVSSKVPDSSTQVWVHPAGSQYRRSILCLRLATQIKGYGLVKLQCLIFSHSGPFASSTRPTPSLPPPSLLPSLPPLPPSLSLPSYPSPLSLFLSPLPSLTGSSVLESAWPAWSSVLQYP